MVSPVPIFQNIRNHRHIKHCLQALKAQIQHIHTIPLLSADFLLTMSSRTVIFLLGEVSLPRLSYQLFDNFYQSVYEVECRGNQDNCFEAFILFTAFSSSAHFPHLTF
jgi:hypothetical protein